METVEVKINPVDDIWNAILKWIVKDYPQMVLLQRRYGRCDWSDMRETLSAYKDVDGYVTAADLDMCVTKWFAHLRELDKNN